MKYLSKNQDSLFLRIRNLILLFFLLTGGIAFAAGEDDVRKNNMTADGLTVVESNRFTEKQIKNGVDWSEYTRYQITPVEVSFRKNWKRDQNRDRIALSNKVTDKDMARIRESMAEIVYEELNATLQTKGGLEKADEADSNTLLFKPRVINLDVYAPDLQSPPGFHKTYVRQAGKTTLFLEVQDAVSGEILGRWVDTREDPDNGYYEWANRITNIARAKLIVRSWAKRLVEGLDALKAVN